MTGQKLWGETPRIQVWIAGDMYTCLIDTGASASVLSESLFQLIRIKEKGMLILPTSGILCSGALRKTTQRVKFQCLVDVKVGENIYQILFLVIPSLNTDIILGIDVLETWGSIINLRKYILSIESEKKTGESENIDFLTEPASPNPEKAKVEDLAGDLFFVQHLNVCHGEPIVMIECLARENETVAQVESELEVGDLVFTDGLELKVDECTGIGDDVTTRQVDILSLNTQRRIEDMFLEKVEKLEGANMAQKSKLLSVLLEHKEIFSDRIGLCTSYVHELHVTDRTPFSHRCRPIPAALMEKTDLVIEKMLREEVIEDSQSQFINPLCIVMKPDGNVRITIDARELNSKTKEDHYRTEPVQTQLDRINGAKLFSLIDLSQSFLQIGLKEESRQYTAFLHRGRQYRFRRTPFGLASSSAALMRALERVFGRDAEECATFYVDDLCIFSPSWDQHIKDLDLVLGRLKENGFTVKPDKLQLGQRQIEFLGFLVSEEGIRHNPEKTGAILEISPPRNVRQLRKFLGVCQYQARFLVNYAQEVGPLRKLLRKDTKWRWTEVEEQAFSRVKKLFSESILLQRPDYNRRFVIFTDASYLGVGSVLLQEDDEGGYRVISVASRSLSPPERKMYVAEMEVCAIYFALTKFRNYIFDKEILLKTDNISLAFLQKCRLSSSRISRYIHEIMSHDITIEHVKGTENTFADMLSRLPRSQVHEAALGNRESKDVIVMRIAIKECLNLAGKMKNLSGAQQSDPVLKNSL